MQIEVREQAVREVLRGHPWVYRRALGRVPDALEPGSVVTLVAGATRLGRGLYDPDSPIAVRVHERGDAPLDDASFARRLEQAFARRDRLFAGGETTAYRLVHGEGDRVPGVVVDRYDRVAVLRLDGGAIAAWLDRLVPILERALRPRGIEHIALREVRPEARSSKGKPPKVVSLIGPDLPERVIVREHGMPMEVDLLRGQKTGAFLDQRENRRRVRALAEGRPRVLNLFSYAGGFSLAAALGGAEHVVSVDVAAGGHASAERSFALAGLDPRAHAFVVADAFDYLAREKERGARFDLVVSDPPSFAPNERSVPSALSAYRRLHRAAADVLSPGGLLCAASCSSHVPLEAFLGTLDDESLGRSDLVVQATYGSPPDHPSLPAFPEGRYLKLCVLG